MNRYIIVSREAGVYDAVYYSREFAERSLEALRITWPGLSWEIEQLERNLPIPGLTLLGARRATKILKRCQKTLSGDSP